MDKKEIELIKRLEKKTKDELIQTILRKNKQINNLQNEVRKKSNYIDKLKDCIFTLKDGLVSKMFYSTHWFTNPYREEDITKVLEEEKRLTEEYLKNK